MKYLSICSGIEAASVAWEPLGWKPVGFAEIEKFPSAVLAHHWPDVPNLGDMTKHHDWPTTLPPDLIVGGCPCQAFSVAGLREGLNDPRGNLTLTFLSIIEQYRPLWVVYENVPGILSDKTGAFGSLLGGLGELGYGFAYRVLDAQYFGVAQRRRRVFVVACLGDWQRAAAVLFESHSLQGHSPPSREARKTLASHPTSSTGRSLRNETWSACHPAGTLGETEGNAEAKDPVITNSNGQDVIGALCASDYKGVGSQYVAEGKVLCMSTGQAGAEIGIGIGTTLNCNHEAPIVCTQYGEIAGSLTARHDSSPCADRGQNVIAIHDMATRHKGTNGSGADVGKGHGLGIAGPDDPMFTLTKGDHHAVAFGVSESPDVAHCLRSGASKADKHESTTYIAHNHIVRRLTPTECERLQGFPDAHTLIPFNGKPAADGPRYKALGNSMAVPVMRWIGERIALFSH